MITAQGKERDSLVKSSSISCKLTFTVKLNQKKDKPLRHLLHFYPAGSLNLQNQFERLEGVIISFN